MHWVEQITYST